MNDDRAKVAMDWLQSNQCNLTYHYGHGWRCGIGGTYHFNVIDAVLAAMLLISQETDNAKRVSNT